MSIDEDFAEFVGARWASLYRLAYLLAASPTGAEDLLQTTLEKAYMNWARIGRMEYAEAYVRRMLANTLVSSRRRAWTGEQPYGPAARDCRGLRRDAGPRPLPALAAGVRAPRPAARGDRAALLRGPERGADRRRPRLRAGHREVTGLGGDGGATTGPGRDGCRRGGGRVMNLDDSSERRSTRRQRCRPPRPDVDRLISRRTGPPAPPQRCPDRRRRRRCVLVGGGAYAVTQDRLRVAGPTRIANRAEPTRAQRRPRRLPSDDGESARAGHLPDAGRRRCRRRRDRGRPDLRRPRLERRELSRVVRGRELRRGRRLPAVGAGRPGPAAPATRRAPDAGRDPAGPGAAARPAPAEHGRPATHARPRPSATTPSTCGCGSTTTARPARATASRRRRGQSRHQLRRRPTEVVIDFWVVDLDGAPVVVDMWHQADASGELVDESPARDSITFATAG